MKILKLIDTLRKIYVKHGDIDCYATAFYDSDVVWYDGDFNKPRIEKNATNGQKECIFYLSDEDTHFDDPNYLVAKVDREDNRWKK